VSIDTQPRAQLDIDMVRDDLLRVSATAARSFDFRLQRTLALLESQPLLGELYDPPSAQHPGLRFLPVLRFTTYVVYYTPNDTGISVVRVLHSSRDASAVFGS
jgi:plasmid stabilization system protein ParE